MVSHDGFDDRDDYLHIFLIIFTFQYVVRIYQDEYDELFSFDKNTIVTLKFNTI